MSATIKKNVNRAWTALVTHKAKNHQYLDRYCVTSVGELARIAQVSLPTARKYIAALEKHKWAYVALQDRSRKYWFVWMGEDVI